MNSVFIKVSVSDRRPKKSGHYYTDKGKQRFNSGTGMFSSCKSGVTEHWFEEITLPTDEEIYAEAGKNSTRTYLAFERGASFILNHIKGIAMSSKLTSVEQSNYNYWSKRTATQYAYKKVLNIDPDLIAEIERLHDIEDSRLYEGRGIMEVIENRDKLRSKGLLPDFPEIPNNRLFDFVMAKHEFDMKYLK